MATWIPESASRNPAARPLGLAGLWAALVREPIALLGLLMVIAYTAVAITAPLLPLRDPLLPSTLRLAGPSMEYPMGTDALGRDVLSRILFGARLSMQVAVVSVAIATIVGGTLGLVSGYLGGVVDLIIGRVMDVFFAFPAILLALGIVAALGPDPRNVILAIGVVYTPIFARVVRGPVLVFKAREFVEAARAVGATPTRIVARHIVPNLLPTLIVQISLALSWAVLTEGALSFLGLSAQPPAPSWGVMLSEGRQYLEFATHLAVFPGLAIMVAVLGFNLLGDGLRDALDPQRR
jgi:peptide/nickel transport system permease protein